MTITAATIVTGLLSGLAYGLLGCGLSLIYRSCRIINIAYGVIGAFGAAVLAKLVIDEDFPWWAALPLALAVGAALAAAVELVVVRRLAGRPPIVLLAATIGISQLVLVARLSLPAVRRGFAPFPAGLDQVLDIGGVRLAGPELTVLVVVPAAVLALTLLLTRTPLGLAIRGAADNADAARLAGVRVGRMSTMVWALSGALATLTVVLLEPLLRLQVAGAPATFGPDLLLKGLVAALVGRLVSLPLALLGGLGVGVIEALTLYNFSPGLRDVVVLVAVLVLVLLRLRHSGSDAGDEELSLGFAPARPILPPALRGVWWAERLGVLTCTTLVAGAAALPLFVHGAGPLYLLARVALFAILGLSLVLLTGWGGQLSLAQVALFGVGALSTAALVDRGVTFPAAVLEGSLVGVLIALLIALPALVVRGLFLGVTTLAFAIAADSWLFRQPFLVGSTETAVVPPPTLFGFGPLGNGGFYELCVATMVVCALAVTALRRSGAGRAIIAVGLNPRRAATTTLSPLVCRLSVFGLSGAFAALAGGLFAGLKTTVGYQDFDVSSSFTVVALVLIGGPGSVAGAVLGSTYVLGLPALLGDSQSIRLLTSSVGLLLLLLYLPSGLDGLIQQTRTAVLEWVARDRPSPTRPTLQLNERTPDAPTAPGTALSATGLTVRIAGRPVLLGVDLQVQRGEVLGLIGANGAGKSTLLNVLSGFQSLDAGTVLADGRDVTGLSAQARARLGFGRVFQDARLFGPLTTRETVLVSLEARRRSELLPALLGLPVARREERRKQQEAALLLANLSLERFAEMPVHLLSTGTRRVVELACLLAQGSTLLLLDEPTAGLAQRESEAFGPLLLDLRERTGATVILVEHDLPLVISVCDRLQCLGLGQTLAMGSPAEVRTDPRVVASYLGTDERAIGRSAAIPVQPGSDRRPANASVHLARSHNDNAVT